MECIALETVDTTWQSVAELDPDSAAEAMFAFSEAQPNLIGFVMSFAEDLSEEASGLCTYMLYVVYQMFENAATDALPVISDEQIEAQYNATCELVDGLHDEKGDNHEEGLELKVSNQPFVFQYVSDAIFEPDKSEGDDVDISEEDAGEIFLMLKCVIDALDQATDE